MSSPPPFKKPRTSCLVDSNRNSLANLTEKLNHTNGMETNGEVNEIDEGLYSRQLYVLGTEGMRRIATSDILICGLGGLGLEIAKNIILAGVRSVTLYDQSPVTWTDLSSHFFASTDDIGHGKAEVSRHKLAELNTHVAVHILVKPKLGQEDFQKFSLVILTQCPHEMCLEVGDICHKLGIRIIIANTCGVFGKVFCDFGDEFTVFDPTGEDPPSVMIQQIEKVTNCVYPLIAAQSQQGLVTCLEETRHNFVDGDFVTFSEVKGMTELNGCEPRKVTVSGPDVFCIGSTSSFSEYISGGICTKVKMPEKINFLSYRESFSKPQHLISDIVKMDRAPQLHLFFSALGEYTKQHKGSLPGSWNQSDSREFLGLVRKLNDELADTSAHVDQIDEQLTALFSYTSSGQCCPVQAVIGGFAAQEAMKACTGKFVPLQQWLYFDATECLPIPHADPSLKDKTPEVVPEGDDAPRGTRYDGQIAIFGQSFQERLLQLKYFLVGAGAIGCELMKNFALMGVGASPGGKLTVTDMDSIERSNLNRQFLFRPWDISKMKAVVAAEAVKRMNPEMNIDAHENRVGPETENIYDDRFFEALDGVANALDNIEARTYVDRRCVYYRKPLLESGTLGTKANVQVVIPYLTESYSSSQDPPEKSFPACTLKNFPYLIEHTLQWARDLFEGLFVQQSQSIASYIRETDKFMERTLAGPGNQPIETLENLKANLVDKKPASFDDCVSWARLLWQDLYSNSIVQLLFNFPSDHRTATGADFWSGTKRCPHPLQFDIKNPMHLDFVMAAANLRAFMFGIPQCRNISKLIPMIEAVNIPVFKPRTGVRIEVTETEAQARSAASMTDASRVTEIRSALSDVDTAKMKLNVVEFEKDDDKNFHMDFITAASNLRATCYNIQPADRLKSKLIAGKIIPAIATTTSLVAGLVCLELYKLVQGHKSLSLYKNSYIDLATPWFAFFEPVPPTKSKYFDTEFSLWDRFELSAPMTLQDFLDYFKTKLNLDVTMLSQDVSMLYAFFMPEARRKERLAMPLEQLVETVSKKRIPSHVRALVFDLCCSDADGEDVDVPYVRYNLKLSN
ncbi:Ubiquitin activating enzyme [Fasciola gigantica]|uniref:E1 ubiquitin-activating enzyme n=1 Tax=Fasciola gigantica TaxID=46835 RepID=A0A504Y452_FASGI|nr:Ubiquitin activating enzyme [Fasciola gigantica]